MTDLTTQVLIEIRDEARKTNARLERLERRQAESEIRISTEIVGVVGAVDRLAEALLDPRGPGKLAERLEDHERRLGELERRTPG
jgi:hypothetical protein